MNLIPTLIVVSIPDISSMIKSSLIPKTLTLLDLQLSLITIK